MQIWFKYPTFTFKIIIIHNSHDNLKWFLHYLRMQIGPACLFMFPDPFPTNASKVLLYHLKYVTTICIHLLHILIKLKYFPTATRIKLF